MRRLFLAATLLALTAAPAAAQSADGAAVVGRSARVYRGLSSLRAEFEQTIADEMVGTFTSRGTLYQAGDARLAMRFSDPEGDAVVVDGERVWVYTPSTTPGQVLRLRLPSGGPVYGYNLLAWFLDRPNERYRSRLLRRDTLHGRTMDVVELVPAVPDLPFRKAVLWLDRGDGLPRRLEIDERAGGRRTLTLSRLRTNGSLPDSVFRFEVPDGVRVIDQ